MTHLRFLITFLSLFKLLVYSLPVPTNDNLPEEDPVLFDALRREYGRIIELYNAGKLNRPFEAALEYNIPLFRILRVWEFARNQTMATSSKRLENNIRLVVIAQQKAARNPKSRKRWNQTQDTHGKLESMFEDRVVDLYVTGRFYGPTDIARQTGINKDVVQRIISQIKENPIHELAEEKINLINHSFAEDPNQEPQIN
jgi:hypothetical protein